MKFQWSFVLLVGVIFFFPAAQNLFAHGTGGSIEQEEDGYLVDIGYSPERLVAQETVRFDFLLFNTESGEAVDFTDLWLRLEQEDQLIFAGGISQPYFGEAGMSLYLPETGTYTGYVRYQAGQDSLAETEFEIVVKEQEVPFWAQTVSFKIFTGLAVGALILSLLAYYSKFHFALPKLNYLPKLTNIKHSLRSRLVFISIVVGLVIGGLLLLLLNHFTTITTISKQNNINVSSQKMKGPEGSVSVVLTSSGFEPADVTIPTGTEVIFTTTTDKPFWPASNLHPSHEIYPEFDPKRALAPNEAWSFTFNRPGEWTMHDHIRAYYTGMIRVVETSL